MHRCDVGQGVLSRAAATVADANGYPTQGIDGTETVFVRHVIADEHGTAPGEWVSLHHLADCDTLVVFSGCEFEHHFTGYQAKVLLDFGQQALHEFRALLFELRCTPVVQRYATALFLQQQPRTVCSEFPDTLEN